MINKKKIFWVAHEGNRSGANNALLDYAEILNNESFEVTVILPSPGNMVSELSKRKLGTKLFYYYNTVYTGNFKIFTWLRKRLRNLLTLTQFMRYSLSEKPHIIITNSIVNTSVFAIAAKAMGIKHIWFIQEFGNKDHGLKFDFGYSFNARLIGLLSARVAVVSDSVRQHLKKYIPIDKMSVIFNRIQIPADFKGRGKAPISSSFKILLLAQLTPGKNQLEALKAFKILCEENRNMELEFAGAEANAEYALLLKSYTVENNLEERVNFSGFSTCPYQKIVEADVVLICSTSEACALTIFETLLLETPIIVSDTGGNRELINNQETGLVYRFGDSQDLADKINLLYNNKVLREKLTSAGKEYATKYYNPAISIDQIKNLFAN